MIGTSGALISIKALSMPVMYSAANKCSTVDTLTLKLFLIVVQSFAEETFSKFAFIILFSLRSVLLKTIPLFLSAGNILILLSNPL